MKFTVGLPKYNPDFTDYIIKNLKSIYEVYFSWGDFPNGRSNQLSDDVLTSWELMDYQRGNLKKITDAGIDLNLLFNANCYGKHSQSRSFFNKIGETIDFLKQTYGLKSVTTTSPLIAKFIKNNFENIEVRASVNMEIGTIEGMQYLSNYFDSFYMKREYNRNFERINILKNWCDENGKKLFMLVNSGCLNYCSAHNFHDNLVAHEDEISQMDNAYNFCGMCKEFLQSEDNFFKLPEYTNFVRPEDIYKYDGLFDAVKLATRVHNNPQMVLGSYIKGRYTGDILKLLEPAHSIYPYVLENGNPLKVVKITPNIVLDC
jgi:hypothetical protein